MASAAGGRGDGGDGTERRASPYRTQEEGWPPDAVHLFWAPWDPEARDAPRGTPPARNHYRAGPFRPAPGRRDQPKFGGSASASPVPRAAAVGLDNESQIERRSRPKPPEGHRGGLRHIGPPLHRRAIMTMIAVSHVALYARDLLGAIRLASLLIDPARPPEIRGTGLVIRAAGAGAWPTPRGRGGPRARGVADAGARPASSGADGRFALALRRSGGAEAAGRAAPRHPRTRLIHGASPHSQRHIIARSRPDSESLSGHSAERADGKCGGGGARRDSA
jgi:hypothetical protein